MSWLLPVITWVAPPLLGAIIGYVTNALALRMLFRPLREKRVFGLRVPLTPGVIPRRRGELADSIGRMVANQLLTPDAVQRQVKQPGFVAAIDTNIASLSERLLRTPLNQLLSSGVPEMTDGVKGALTDGLNRLFSSHGFIYALRALLTEAVNRLGERRVDELLGDLDIAHLGQEALARLLQQADLGDRLEQLLSELVAQRGQRFTALLDEGALEQLVAALDGALPTLAAPLFTWLREPDVRGELESRGRAILRDVLDQLNVFQKFFMNAGQYDAKLNERMPQIVDQTITRAEAALQDPEVRARLVRGLQTVLQRIRREGMADMGTTTTRLMAVVARLAERAVVEYAPAELSAWLTDLRRRLGPLPVREAAARLFGVQPPQVVDFAATRLLSLLATRETAELVVAQGSRILFGAAAEANVSLADLLAVDPERKARLDSFFSQQLQTTLIERLPGLVASLNVQQMVVDKVNSLAVEDVERLLLTVVARHLKWINLFGAVLGALIGVTQLLLRIS